MRHARRYVLEELGQVDRGAAGSSAVAAPAANALRSLGQRASRHGGGCSEIEQCVQEDVQLANPFGRSARPRRRGAPLGTLPVV